MNSNQFVLLLVVFCGIALHAVLGQFFSLSGLDEGDHIQEENSETNGLDTEEDDALTRIGQAESIDDFLSLLRRNGENITLEIIESENAEAEKLSIATGGRLAVPDNCSPRNTTVRITMDEETDSDTAFFPRCTKIERCGGCCSSPNLECVPSYTERVVLKVLKGRVPYPGAPHLEYTGFATKIEERHMTCRVNCKLNAESCGPLKHFSRRKCNCRCKVRQRCVNPLLWDSEDCSCKCPTVTECCSEPNCGMMWNPTTCECVLSNDGRVVIVNEEEAMTTTTQRTTPTTTTTTRSTTPADPCHRLQCAPTFRLARGRNNTCRCVIIGRRGRRTRG